MRRSKRMILRNERWVELPQRTISPDKLVISRKDQEILRCPAD